MTSTVQVTAVSFPNVRWPWSRTLCLHSPACGHLGLNTARDSLTVWTGRGGGKGEAGQVGVRPGVTTYGAGSGGGDHLDLRIPYRGKMCALLHRQQSFLYTNGNSVPQ